LRSTYEVENRNAAAAARHTRRNQAHVKGSVLDIVAERASDEHLGGRDSADVARSLSRRQDGEAGDEHADDEDESRDD